MDQMGDLIKRLRLCVRWFKRVEEGYVQEKEKLQSDLESAQKKCIDTGQSSLVFVTFFFINTITLQLRSIYVLKFEHLATMHGCKLS